MDGQPQMIGNIAACHRQGNAVERRQPFRRDQQKGRDSLIGVATTEQKYALVRAIQRAFQRPILPRRIRSVVQCRTAGQRRIGNRLRGGIASAIFDAENIALIEKARKLAVSVDVEVTGSHGAGYDFEPAISRVALRKNDLALAKLERCILRVSRMLKFCRKTIHATSPILNWYLRRPHLRVSSAFADHESIRRKPKELVCAFSLVKTPTYYSLSFRMKILMNLSSIGVLAWLMPLHP